jgi:hypothetical protein
MKKLIVQGLEQTCTILDRTFPRVYWCRWFATWSDKLDQRWQTGFWKVTDE